MQVLARSEPTRIPVSITATIAPEPVEEVKEEVVEEIEKKNDIPQNVSVKIEKKKGFFGRIWAWIKGLF